MKKLAKRSTSSSITASRCAIRSVQCSRPGVATGAVTRRKLRPRSLVRINHSPLRWSTEYSCSSSRAAISEKLAGRIVRAQHPRLARRVAGRLHHDVLAVARAPSAEVEALVVILIRPARLRCAPRRARVAKAGTAASAARLRPCKRASDCPQPRPPNPRAPPRPPASRRSQDP